MASSDRFPTTRGSLIEALRGTDPTLRDVARDALLEAFWKPTYKYLRRRCGCDRAGAEDLVQGFFVEALERDVLGRYDRERGGFRSYFRLCLDRFVANERKSESRQKRGGGARHVPLDFSTAERELDEWPDPDALSPEDYFFREWMRALFSDSVASLRDELSGAGREKAWELFERYDLEGDRERVTYADLARESGLSVSTVTNSLAAARRRLKEIVLGKVRALTSSDADFRRESRRIFGAESA